jgi:hypothetical protein
MADAINAGQDLHRMVAARVTGKPAEEINSQERQAAKAINFGKPGGMGCPRLRQYANASYGVELSEEEVQELSDAWLELFSEMHQFLKDDNDAVGVAVARLFDLTPQSYFDHTGCPSFLDHPANEGRADAPHPILGWMCLKVLAEELPTKRNGAAYSADEIDYFWSQVQRRLNVLPVDWHDQVSRREASFPLRVAVKNLADRRGVFTLTGRLRGQASYTARHNTIFQGLAADGAKLGLWLLWRAGYRIVNFIHDEVLIEVAANDDLTQRASHIRELMREGMRQVVPDIRVEVEFAATDRWYKSAKAVYDESGGLRIWTKECAAA